MSTCMIPRLRHLLGGILVLEGTRKLFEHDLIQQKNAIPPIPSSACGAPAPVPVGSRLAHT
eukprot:6393852-Pyramimonas_sp.AAC.1